MNVRDLAARFERPSVSKPPPARVISRRHIPKTSVSELRNRLENAVIQDKHTAAVSISFPSHSQRPQSCPNPNASQHSPRKLPTSVLSKFSRTSLPARAPPPTSTPAPAPHVHQGDEHVHFATSTISDTSDCDISPSASNIPLRKQKVSKPAKLFPKFPSKLCSQFSSELFLKLAPDFPTEASHAFPTISFPLSPLPPLPHKSSQSSVLHRVASPPIPSKPEVYYFTPVHSTNLSFAMQSAVVEPAAVSPKSSNAIPKTVSEVHIVPSVSIGELDDIDGVEHVDDYDSQEEELVHLTAGDTFRRIDIVDEYDESYRSLTQSEGSVEYQYIETVANLDETFLPSTSASVIDLGDDDNGPISPLLREHTPRESLGHLDIQILSPVRKESIYKNEAQAPIAAVAVEYEGSEVSPAQRRSKYLKDLRTPTEQEGHYKPSELRNSKYLRELRNSGEREVSPTKLPQEQSQHLEDLRPLAAGERIAHEASHRPPELKESKYARDSAASIGTGRVERKGSHRVQAGLFDTAQSGTEANQYDSNIPERFTSENSPRRLPKAKVLIARRRNMSVNLSSETITEVDDDESGALQRAISLGRNVLVQEFPKGSDIFAGRVSLVDRTFEEKENSIDMAPFRGGRAPPVSMPQLGGRKMAEHGRTGRQNAYRNKYDEYLDAEELNNGKRYSEVENRIESEVFGERRRRSKLKYSHRLGLFRRKRERVVGGGKVGKERLGKERSSRMRSSRMEYIREEGARRSAVLSGALGRVSMAADPWIDFITDAKAMAVPKKARGPLRRAIRRLFGGGKERAGHHRMIRE